jgi:putative component of toxin-antitoxin plasmid stabilization module
LDLDILTPDEGAAVVKRIALTVGVAVAAALALTSCVRLVQNGFDDKHSVSDQVTEVRLQNGSGDVTVRSKDGATETEIRRRVEYPKGSDKPGGVSHRLEGSTLVLDGCGSGCSVSYEVTVPSKDVKITGRNNSGDVLLERVASVDVEVGSGRTTVREVAGAVNIDNDSGDLDANTVGGDFVGRVGSGSTRLAGMGGSVTIDADSGDVDVAMTTVSSLRADVGSGSLDVTVPQGAYKIDVDAGSGDKKIDVKNDPNGAAELYLRAGSGDVTVRAA